MLITVSAYFKMHLPLLACWLKYYTLVFRLDLIIIQVIKIKVMGITKINGSEFTNLEIKSFTICTVGVFLQAYTVTKSISSNNTICECLLLLYTDCN